MKRIVLILIVMISFCVQAQNNQNKLILNINGIEIDKVGVYGLTNDTIVYIDTTIQITNIELGEGIKNGNSHVVKFVQEQSNFTYSPNGDDGIKEGVHIGNRKYYFTLGGDSMHATHVYVDNMLRYIIIPKPQNTFDIHDNVLILYKDSLVFRNGGNTLSVVVRDSVSIEDSIYVEWVSLQGIFDGKEHKLKIAQKDSVLFDSVIVNETACTIIFPPNKNTTIVLDDLVICTIGSDKGHPPLSPIIWVIIGAIVLELIICRIIFHKKLFSCLKKKVKKEKDEQQAKTGKDGGKTIVGDDAQNDGKDTSHDSDAQDGGGEDSDGEILFDIPTDVTFSMIWGKLTEIQKKNAISYISQEKNLQDVGKLDLEQLINFLTESQYSALRDRFANEFNLQEVIQKLSVDDLIGILSKSQSDGIGTLFKQPESQPVVVTEKVDLDKMSAIDIFKAMPPAKQMEFAALLPQSKLILPDVLLKYVISQLRGGSKKQILDEFLKEQFGNYGISKDVWKVISNRINRADDSTQEISLEITKARLEKNDVDVWNYVAKVIADKCNKPNMDSENKLPEEWDGLLTYISTAVSDKQTATKTDEPNSERNDKLSSESGSGDANSDPEISTNDISAIKDELESTKKNLSTTQKELDATKNTLETTRDELETARGTLETTRKELETTNGTLVTTRKELETTKASLSTSQADLETTKETLSTTQKDFNATKNTLETTRKELETANGTIVTTRKELETTKGNLDFTKGELLITQGKLRKTEGDLENTIKKLLTTEDSLGRANSDISRLLQRWKDSMSETRSEYESIPQEILDRYNLLFTGSDNILQGMVDKIISDRRSNLKKFIDNINSINIDEKTTSSDIKAAIRDALIDDLGGQYPGWIDILMRLYAYTRVTFIREELQNIGLHIDLITAAAERTLLLMSQVGIHVDMPDLFVSVYDKNIYDLEPIRTIDKIIPSVSNHAKSGIVADIYRVGYKLENGENKKPIVSIY